MFSSRSAGPTAEASPLLASIKRRSFFAYAGATAGATALVLAGCKKDNNGTSPSVSDLGSGDLGVLNYAYALKQLEAAFYARVLTGTYYQSLATTSAEYQIISDIALHERIHLDYLRSTLVLLNTTGVLNTLTPDFSTINFSDRTTVAGSGFMGVLNVAQMFEDLGVAALNGAARFVVTADYLTLIGKIVSVEARHAALIRDILLADGAPGLGNGFVGPDVVDSSTTSATARMEKSLSPAAVLPKLNVFLSAASQLNAPSLG